MRVRLLPVVGLDERELAAWRLLAARALEPNPYFEPEAVLPAVTVLADREVFLLAAEDADGWAACLPVVSGAWRGLDLPCLTTWLHPHAGLGSPLVAADRPVAALAALLAGALSRPGVGCLGLEWIGTGGPVEAALREALAASRLRVIEHDRFERAILLRRPDGLYFSSKRRKDVRRLRRRLEERLGAPVRMVDRSSDPLAPAEYVELEARGRKGKHRTALAASDEGPRYFRELCLRFGDAGRLQVLALEAGEATLAMQVNVLAGDALFALRIAYDETYAPFSPGIQLEVDAAAAFHADPKLTWVDSCADRRDRHMKRLWPERRAFVSLVVPARTPRGAVLRVLVPGLLAGGRIRRALRRRVRALRRRRRRARRPRLGDGLRDGLRDTLASGSILGVAGWARPREGVARWVRAGHLAAGSAGRPAAG